MLDTRPVVFTDTYKRLKQRLQEAAQISKKHSPVIIRHHNDCDGYCGGIALEQALLELREPGTARIFRFPLRSPHYKTEDAVMDLRTTERFHNNRAIVIIVDTGSSHEDEPGLRLVRLHNAITVVIDHHPIDLPQGTSFLRSIHINPYIVGGKGDFTAGMLGVELAHMLNPVAKITHLAALAGIGDKVSGPSQKGYLEVARRQGYTEAKLWRLYLALDYLISFRSECWSLLRELLFDAEGLQEQLIRLFSDESESLRRERLEVMMSHTTIKGRVAFVELSKLFSGYSYPPPGRSVGLLYDELKKQGNFIVLGIGNGFLIMRGELPKGFTLHWILKELSKSIPGVTGGGHDMAGSIHFPPVDTERVRAGIIKLLTERQSS